MGTYLGQNFLIDSTIRQCIADAVRKLYGQTVCESLIEIGPGKGSLTKLIKDISGKFLVIEKDHTFVLNNKLTLPGLEDIDTLLSDILEVDTQALLAEKGRDPTKTLIVGNLPYYITSPIFRKFFSGEEAIFPGGIFLIQKEVAEKILTSANKKSFLRRLLNFHYTVSHVKNVPPKAFSPAPKVTSEVIRLEKHDIKHGFTFSHLVQFLELYGPFSRKTLGAISKIITKHSCKNQDLVCELFTIPEHLQKKRLEEVTWDEMEEILK